MPEVGRNHRITESRHEFSFLESQVRFVNYLFFWVGIDSKNQNVVAKEGRKILGTRQCFPYFWHTWVLQLQANGRQVAINHLCVFSEPLAKLQLSIIPDLRTGCSKTICLFAWDFCASSHAPRAVALRHYHSRKKSYTISSCSNVSLLGCEKCCDKFWDA